MEYCIYMVTMAIIYLLQFESVRKKAKMRGERGVKEITEGKSNGIMEGFWKCL